MYHMPVSHSTSAIRLHVSDCASDFRHLHLSTAVKAHRATEPPACCCRALMLSCACGLQSGSVSTSAMETSTGPGPAGPMWQTSLATIPAGGTTLHMYSASALLPFLYFPQQQVLHAGVPGLHGHADLVAGRRKQCTRGHGCHFRCLHITALHYCAVHPFQAFQVPLLCWCRQFVALALEYLSRLSYPTYLTSEHSQVGRKLADHVSAALCCGPRTESEPESA